VLWDGFSLNLDQRALLPGTPGRADLASLASFESCRFLRPRFPTAVRLIRHRSTGKIKRLLNLFLNTERPFIYIYYNSCNIRSNRISEPNLIKHWVWENKAEICPIFRKPLPTICRLDLFSFKKFNLNRNPGFIQSFF
jgi:hypothetical protein